jgi:hypothetical protein
MMTPPPSSVRSEPLPLEEACERAARSTIAGTGASGSDEGAPRPALLGVLPAVDFARPDPPEPGGLMPAPNRAAELEVVCPVTPPVPLA